jgi:hypothetical protein
MTAEPIDGRVELSAAIASPKYRGVAGAPDATIYQRLQEGLTSANAVSFEETVTHLILRLAIWWSPAAYAAFPVLVPWAVRDRSCRYDAGPEAWGSPRDDGHLRDDNSIIKKLPLTAVVAAPEDHPYRGRKVWRGFTACHVWRDLPAGRVSGEDPWLYSFLPNIVWMPTPLAPLSDRHGSFTQRLLQTMSYQIFRATVVSPSVKPYVDKAWEKLPAPTHQPRVEVSTMERLAVFAPSTSFLRRRLEYNRRLTRSVSAVRSSGHADQKIICSRYTSGLPELAPDVLREFELKLRRYDDAVARSLPS